MKKFKLLYYFAIFFSVFLSVFTFCLFLSNIDMIPQKSISCIITIILSLLVGNVIQTLFHEIGHVFFGLMTNYKFVSLRIFSISLQAKQNKIKLTKNPIPSVLGLNVMSPKAANYKNQPFMLYLLGGVIFNAILSFIFFLIAITASINIYCKIVLFVFSFVGFLFIINNGIPNIINGLANDGYNVYYQRKYDIIRKSMYTQLKIQAALYNGIHPVDMPKEWFEWDNDDPEIAQNPLFINNLLNRCGLLMEERNFNAAKSTFEYISHDTNKSLSIYINEAKCELLFLKLINGESIQDLYTKDLQQYLKTRQYSLNKNHIMYALYLIHKKDKAKANSIYKETLKLSANYAPKAEAELELEMMNYVKENFKNKKIGVI